jgi:ech hydrogenase subunit B
MTSILLGILALILAPLAGGLIAGLDRRVTARVQSRFGPPILQPFYDVAKLFGKEPRMGNVWQIFCAYIYLLGAAVSVFLFFAGADLLLLFFVQAIGAVFLVFGALARPSPYSQIGAQRELMQILTYEPLLILVFVGLAKATGSFKVAVIWSHPEPLLLQLPLLYLVLTTALSIKLRKSPFDFSTSHHGHQEIVKGVLTEYSGPYLGLIELAHWYEVVLVLGICALFWSTGIIGLAILLGVTYFAEILVDNTTARLTWRWMLGSALLAGLALSFLNLVWLYLA